MGKMQELKDMFEKFGIDYHESPFHPGDVIELKQEGYGFRVSVYNIKDNEILRGDNEPHVFFEVEVAGRFYTPEDTFNALFGSEMLVDKNEKLVELVKTALERDCCGDEWNEEVRNLIGVE